uniref:Si:ch211-212k18.9 n=1 Tax=Gadus morhua TaxID=8049 RepID=A0A8C5AIE9_GADMO
MADKEEGTRTTGNSPPIEVEQGPLVSVTFQKNPARKQKYLEAQPKELGITQIGLTLYQMSWVFALVYIDSVRGETGLRVLFTIASVVVILAGCLAIAATTLHIPTLRACLTVQILAIAFTAFGLITMSGEFHEGRHACQYLDYDHHNETTNRRRICEKMQNALNNLHTGGMLVQMALVAISITLAVYCCKVINCCSPGSRMPVITLQAPSNISAPE